MISVTAQTLERSWASYRRRRNLYYGGVYGFLGLAAGLYPFQRYLNGSRIFQALGPLFLALWLAAVVGMFWLSWWRCPRCGREFFLPILPRFMTRACKSCGLPKFSTDPDAVLVRNRRSGSEVHPRG